MSGPTTILEIASPIFFAGAFALVLSVARLADDAQAGMQMTVRFSFKRNGGIIAAPRLTFATAGASADIRDTYLKPLINASPARWLHSLEIHR